MADNVSREAREAELNAMLFGDDSSRSRLTAIWTGPNEMLRPGASVLGSEMVKEILEREFPQESA
jgi:hypothetical protein